MRLVIVNSSTTWCGVDQVCREVTRGMRARGHDVLNAVRADSEYRRALDDVQFPWITLPERALRQAVGEWRRFLADLRRFQPDVVHIHTGRDWGMGVFLPRSAAPVVVSTRHNGYSIGRLKARLYRARFERIFAVSSFVARVLTEEDGVSPEQVRVLRNPLALAGARSRDSAKERFIREVARVRDPDLSLEGRREPFRVGFIGRYTRPKGIDVVHQLAHRMADEPGLRFYTVGRPGGDEDRALMAELERHPPPNLVDLGFVTDVAGFYAFVDVTLMPSTRRWRDAAPLTALEGQAMGTPVIANDSGAIPEAVIHGENGLIVADNDVEEFVRNILTLRDDPGMLACLARAGVEHARAWAPEAVLDDHERAYLTLIRDRDPRKP